jgi:hypothetical protein
MTLAEAIYIGEKINIKDDAICISSDLNLKKVFEAFEVLVFSCKELQYSNNCLSCLNKTYQKSL